MANYTLIAAGIDSLTYSYWPYYFQQVTRGALGDGGQGYLSLTQAGGEIIGMQFAMSGMREFTITDPEGLLSFDGTGLTAAAAKDASFSATPSSRWTNARLFIEQQPGGGTMRCGTGTGTLSSVDTNAAAPSLAYVDLSYTSDSAGDSLRCVGITGHVTVFGALFTRGTGGLLLAYVARPGRTLASVAAQDPTFRRAWFSVLQPKWWILNGGMNDRSFVTPDQHRANITAIMNDVHAGSPTTKTAVVQSNEPGDALAPYYFQLVPAQQAAATDTSSLYIDIRTQFGTYAQAQANGLMGDQIHPSGAGYKLIGEYTARQIGLYTTLPDPGPTR